MALDRCLQGKYSYTRLHHKFCTFLRHAKLITFSNWSTEWESPLLTPKYSLQQQGETIFNNIIGQTNISFIPAESIFTCRSQIYLCSLFWPAYLILIYPTYVYLYISNLPALPMFACISYICLCRLCLPAFITFTCTPNAYLRAVLLTLLDMSSLCNLLSCAMYFSMQTFTNLVILLFTSSSSLLPRDKPVTKGDSILHSDSCHNCSDISLSTTEYYHWQVLWI